MPILRPKFVNETRFSKTGKVHILNSQTHRQRVSKLMWIPTPIYERIPQFWFLLGLLFIATGLYVGFEYSLIFWYGGIGFVCCMYGVGIFFVRRGYRRGRQVAGPLRPRQARQSERPLPARRRRCPVGRPDRAAFGHGRRPGAYRDRPRASAPGHGKLKATRQDNYRTI